MTVPNYKFGFTTPRIAFGNGRIKDLPQELLSLVKSKNLKNPKVLLVTGGSSLKRSGNLDKITANLSKAGIGFVVYDKVDKEPTTSVLNEGKEIALNSNCNLVVGIGGGSAMDTAKGIAGLVSNGGITEEYLAGKEFKAPTTPFVLIPTTAGTGSEVTNNAVVKDVKSGIKKSIRGLWASLALLDPELTLSLPKAQTAYPGADALVQAIEAFVSKASNFLTDMFAKEAILLLGVTLPKVCDNLTNIEYREKMMLGSLMGAFAFANGRLGAVHGFAHPIGIKHDVSHGLICGLLLPYVMEYNVVIESVAEKFAWMATLFYEQKILLDWGVCPKKLPTETRKKAEWSISKIKDMFTYCGIPLHLKEVGIKEAHLDEIVKDTTGPSLENNPRDTDKKALKEILLNAL